MKIWLIKAAIQKTISMLPFSNHWNDLMQRYVTRSNDLESHGKFQNKLEICQQLSSYFETTTGRSLDGARVVELGTGWFAVVPIGLFLKGASEIWTWDIVRHLRKDTFKQTIDLFIQFEKTNQLKEILPDVKSDRLSQLQQIAASAERKTPQELLKQLNIHALIGDVRKSELNPQSIDFVFSHQVLEHLSRQDTRSIFIEFRKMLQSNGVMCHNIGMADQFANNDSSITPFNFLKYSEKQWKLFNNSIIPQSRLRVSDYRELLEQAGFRINREDNLLGEPEDLRSVKLASEFTRYAFDDLLVLYTWLVATPG